MPLDRPTNTEVQQPTENPLRQGLGEIFGPSNSEDFSQQTRRPQHANDSKGDQNTSQPLLPSLEIENGNSDSGSEGTADSGESKEVDRKNSEKDNQQKEEGQKAPKDLEERKKKESEKPSEKLDNPLKDDGKKIPGVPPEALHIERKS